MAERTFIAIKPDGVQRGLVGEILGRFERKGFKLVGLKQITPSRALAEQHYGCLLYTSPSPRDLSTSRMPSSA